MKKIAFSAFATGSLALLVGVTDTEASSYTVQPGDSLWKIASTNTISMSDLKQLNNLTSDMIYPNQTLKLAASTVNAPTTISKKPVQTAPVPQTVPVESTSTYVVMSGDTLSKIANQHKTTVSAIQQLNGLSDDIIYIGQALKVTGTFQAVKPLITPPKSEPVATTAPPKIPTPSIIGSTNGTVRVVAGDTLSSIAYQQGISVTQLMNWNNLTSSSIRVGQVLKVENSLVATMPQTKPVSAPVITPPVSITPSTVGKIVSTATSFLGTPYIWGGASARGFDCSGYIHYIYTAAGISVPRTNTIGLDARSYEVSNPQIGDLVFFKDTYRPGISHVGIYLGDNIFIHAGGDRVQISFVNDLYWSQHFDSYKRFYSMN